MTNEKKQTKPEGRRPDFISNQGVMIWQNQDKNEKTYLSVRIPLLGINVNCFSKIDSPEEEVDEPVEE